MALSDLLQRIKTTLGIGSSRRGRQDQTVRQSSETQQPADQPGQSSGNSVDVTVEREPATESEDAVKGTETATTEPETAEPETAEPETTDEEPETAESEATEPEAAEAEPESASEAEPESATAGADDAGGSPDAGTDEPVDAIKGIGPTYADRLGEAGVETVADLAGSDPEALADRSDIAQGRLENWIEKAKHR